MRWILFATLLVSFAGCAGSPTAPDQMFADADFRFADRASEEFQRTEDLALEPGRHTLMVSVESQDGFAISFQGPPQKEPYSGVMMPSPQHGFGLYGRVSIADLRYTTWDTQGGDWTLTFGCNGPCIYTVAVDQNDTVPDPPQLPVTPKQASAHGTLTDGGDELTFDVARVSNQTMIVMDFHSEEAITFKIYDADGKQAGWWNMDHAIARGWSYQSRADGLTAGEWTLKIGCDGTCRFDIGVL